MVTSSLSQCNVNTQARQLKESSIVTLSNRHFLVVLGISSPMGVGEYLHNINIIIYIYIYTFFFGDVHHGTRSHICMLLSYLARHLMCARRVANLRRHVDEEDRVDSRPCGGQTWDAHLPPFWGSFGQYYWPNEPIWASQSPGSPLHPCIFFQNHHLFITFSTALCQSSAFIRPALGVSAPWLECAGGKWWRCAISALQAKSELVRLVCPACLRVSQWEDTQPECWGRRVGWCTLNMFQLWKWLNLKMCHFSSFFNTSIFVFLNHFWRVSIGNPLGSLMIPWVPGAGVGTSPIRCPAPIPGDVARDPGAWSPWSGGDFPWPDLLGGLEPWNFNEFYDFPIMLGMSSSQLTNSYFSEGLKPPARYIYIYCVM